MNESHLRSVFKAVSWRIFGTLATMIIVYLFTHKLNVSIYVGMFEFISKIALFYFHERIWGYISFGVVNTKKKDLPEMVVSQANSLP